MNEILKDIKGFEEIYQVSNQGYIQNKRTGKILKGGLDKDGYRRVMLCSKGKRKAVRVCRIVAESFIPNQNNYPIVNHKDENKQNDEATNIEWCTYSYNRNYGSCNEKIQNTFSKKGISKSIKSINLKTGEVTEYNSISEVKKDGYSFDCVRKCLHKKIQTYRGCKWEFKGDEYNWLDLKLRCKAKK